MLHIRCSRPHVPLNRQFVSHKINLDETIVHRRKAASAAWVACASPVLSISRHHHTRISQPSGPIRLSAGKTSLMTVPDMANDPYTQLKVTGGAMLPGTAAAAVGGNLQSPPTVQHSTLLLQVDSRDLPALETPDSSTVDSILTATSAPDLSSASCPHLYYTWAPDTPAQSQPAPASDSSNISRTSSVHALQQAAELLRRGEPVAIPTETVYGLAANALSASAVSAVFAAKGRPSDNPLIVHVSDLHMLAQLYPQQQQEHGTPQPTSNGSSSSSTAQVDSKTPPCGSSSSSSLSFIPQQYHRLIAAFWPGPLTLLLPASPLIPAAVTAGLPTVAVRMPAHPVARALIAAAGVPLAAPSANTSGRPSPTTAQHVMQDLAGRIAAVVDGGACDCGVESTVLDGLRNPPVVLRPGGVTAELLEQCPDMHGLQVGATGLCACLVALL